MKHTTENIAATPDIWLPHRVSYGETDAMGVVYYAEYLHYFERARSEFLRQFGMSYNEVEERGVFLPVREASCRYRSPLRFDNLVYVRALISEWRRASIIFTYEIHNEAKTQIMATGQTQHACVDRTGRPVPTPDWLKNICLGRQL